jgi:hypothetical protein
MAANLHPRCTWYVCAPKNFMGWGVNGKVLIFRMPPQLGQPLRCVPATRNASALKTMDCHWIAARIVNGPSMHPWHICDR